RKLDLGASLVGAPKLLLLDEPTTGLDPRSRIELWDTIRTMVGQGTDVLLTTQYLDEAEALADLIVVIDHGTVIAGGTARELTARIGSEHLEVTLAAPHPDAERALAPLAAGPVHTAGGGRRLVAPIVARHGLASAVILALDGVGVTVDDIEVHRPSLDDVFFALTGRAPAPTDAARSTAGREVVA
ncbi:MAG: ABC transporter, partial [Candidatus Dormibacteria bacterium]